MKTFEDLRDDLYEKLGSSTRSSTEWVKHDPAFKELCERYTEFYNEILSEVSKGDYLDLWALLRCLGHRKMPSWWASAADSIKVYELEYFIQHDRDFR